MAGRAGRTHRGDDDGTPGAVDGPALVRIHDLAGRPRGVGFAADHQGTLITSHEAVDGLRRLVLRTADARDRVVTADEITPLPDRGLALVRAEGLGVDPLPVTARDRTETGSYVRLAAGCWREARVLGVADATYTATDRFHLLGGALELAIGTAGRDALRLGGGAAGGPVLDVTTGAVVAVVGTALTAGPRDSGFAVPLRPATAGPLADLLARNAATVPAYGADLNLAGVLQLTATSVGSDGPPAARAAHPTVVQVERAATARQFAAFTASRADVLALVGPPGSGRTTELAALAARRGSGPEPAPTLWLRGADLGASDVSVADAASRALTRAARIVTASRPELPGGLGDLTPERLAHLARAAGRPLLLLLDGPEEMPPVLAHRLHNWTQGTARWLRETGARMVVGCREEYWERAGEGFAPEALHDARDTVGAAGLPPCVPLGDLTDEEAREARLRYGVPDDALVAAEARHPLTLRLLSEVRAALGEAGKGDAGQGDAVQGDAGQGEGRAGGSGVPQGRALDRHDVFAAHLDLMCLRIAERIADENGLGGTAVRRLAAKVAGQVHEAARSSLGPGQGELDRKAFETVFPWGPAPRRLGRGTGWASAVLTEGLLVPAGGGYRFAHEELADWLQGTHLDLDEALRALVHRHAPPHPLPVPHHRIGPVVQALLLVARQHGPAQLVPRLAELVHALDADPDSWWAARLLGEVLRRVPDGTPYLRVLRLLADRLAAWRGQHPYGAREFGPGFWTGLPVAVGERLDLLRRLMLADPAPGEGGGPRYLDAVAALLVADPVAVQPHLTRWFADERALPATPHATVATAAQALLHTHRHRALDDLTDALADRAHPYAEELLAALAEEEPSALCRAVDRWAHDPRPARHEAAMTFGPRVAPHAHSAADRDLLRYAALAVLATAADAPLHGAALGMLVRDPRSRARHLPKALARFGAGDPRLPPSALVTALNTHPEPVLEAFRARMMSGGPVTMDASGAGEALRTLADVTPPALAPRVAVLVREAIGERPEWAEPVAAYVDRRLDEGPDARAVLFPLVTGLLDGGPERMRAGLAGVLAGPGAPASRAARDELREFLLTHEREPAVLDALLRGAVPHGGAGLGGGARLGGGAELGGQGGARGQGGSGGLGGHGGLDGRGGVDGRGGLGGLVWRIGGLLVRTPEGAARFDRALVDLGRHVPGFAALVAGWLTESPEEWAAVVGPSTRRMIENLAGTRVPA
ncbi:serine protease [Streptomyces sp. NPDC088387]|uniref:serine protease n=1 Tax=Streptomyces sp. NPDC088387 TaxID=3365859 RepID=UPI0038229159